MPRATTRSYAGRQVDLELLKHIEETLPKQPVEPDVVETPRIVSGIEKAVQRYTKLFLTNLGSVRLDTTIGNDLLRGIAEGRVQNQAELDHLYSEANAATLDALSIDDEDTDVYGDIPDDERIESTTLENLELVYDSMTGGRVKVHIILTTAAGNDFRFIIPVAAGVT